MWFFLEKSMINFYRQGVIRKGIKFRKFCHWFLAIKCKILQKNWPHKCSARGHWWIKNTHLQNQGWVNWGFVRNNAYSNFNLFLPLLSSFLCLYFSPLPKNSRGCASSNIFLRDMTPCPPASTAHKVWVLFLLDNFFFIFKVNLVSLNWTGFPPNLFH